MGWSSGTEIACGIWNAIEDYIPKLAKPIVAEKILRVLEDSDWDCQDEWSVVRDYFVYDSRKGYVLKSEYQESFDKTRTSKKQLAESLDGSNSIEESDEDVARDNNFVIAYVNDCNCLVLKGSIDEYIDLKKQDTVYFHEGQVINAKNEIEVSEFESHHDVTLKHIKAVLDDETNIWYLTTNLRNYESFEFYEEDNEDPMCYGKVIDYNDL